MASVVGFKRDGSNNFCWIVLMERMKDGRKETYSFIALTRTASIWDLLNCIRKAFVDPLHGEKCTASLVTSGRFVKCYFIFHDKDDLAARLCPMVLPVELTDKGSVMFDEV